MNKSILLIATLLFAHTSNAKTQSCLVAGQKHRSLLMFDDSKIKGEPAKNSDYPLDSCQQYAKYNLKDPNWRKYFNIPAQRVIEVSFDGNPSSSDKELSFGLGVLPVGPPGRTTYLLSGPGYILVKEDGKFKHASWPQGAHARISIIKHAGAAELTNISLSIPGEIWGAGR